MVRKYAWPIGVIVLVILGGLFYVTSMNQPKTGDETSGIRAEDSEGDKKTDKSSDAKTGDKGKEAEGIVATYTAKAGDSYTVMARKAVQTHAKLAKQTLSQAEVIAAETYLTQGAGSPELEVGQRVKLEGKSIAAAVKKAQSLTASELSAWQTYVPYVNFDTSQNG